jgi:hypothetical protein
MKVSSRARPIRVAYLLEECEHSGLMLDAIFAFGFGCWGGRFHLIVPCENGAPRPSFVPWMKAYDPDLVYSYCDLTDACIEEIHESIYPSFLTRHKAHEGDGISARSFRPQQKIPLLSVETLVPYVALPAKGVGSQLPPLIDTCFGASGEDRFIQSNFGGFTHSAGYSMPQNLNEFCLPLHVLSDDELLPRQKYGLQHLQTIGGRLELLSESTKRSVLSVARLSAISVPRLNFHYSEWAQKFNIVVGDSFLDRITFWNSRALFPRWRDREYVDLIIPEKDLGDKVLLGSISEFLKVRNRVSRDGYSGNPRAIIRSSSVEIERLTFLAEQLRGDSGWIGYETAKIDKLEDHLPSTDALEQAYFAYSDGIGAANSESWAESHTADDQINVEAPQPIHLKHSPAHILSRHSGAWAVDLAIPRIHDYSKYQNVAQHWALPKRLRITPAFRRGYQLGRNGAVVMPRASLDGYLTLFADASTNLGDVRVPSDESAIRIALMSGRDWWPFIDKHDGTSQMPNQRAFEVNRSGDGRYFWGVLNQFGGLAEIRKILLHGFWRSQFEKLGASSSRTQERIDMIVPSLQKRLGKHLDEPISNHISLIAGKVLEEAELRKFRVDSLSWDDLVASHEQFMTNYLKQDQSLHNRIEEAEWRKEQRDSLGPSVQRLCQKGVLHQGFEAKCAKCLHKFWVSIEKLDKLVSCEVCHNAAPAPVGKPWDFRLNEFLREALRSHGILPLFWALEKGRDSREQSFFFEGPLDVFFTRESYDKNEKDTDLDLTVVSDGIVQMFEVKQSARQMKKAVEFASVAKQLRPDVATIAVMEPISEKIQGHFAEFSRQLDGTGIEPRLLTADIGSDFSNYPSLNETISMRIF